MKTILQKTNAFILSIILMCSVFPIEVNAAYEIPKTCQVQTDVGATNIVKTLDYSYDYNTYFSLRDIAMILKDTEKNFSLDITKNAVALNIGNAYIPVGTENIPWENSENPDIPLRRNEFKVNGQKVSYYTMIMMLPSGGYDCFMMAVDLAMLLDMDITVARAGVLQFNTQSSFSISPAILQQTGYFYGVNSVLVGDATTGEVFINISRIHPFL